MSTVIAGVATDGGVLFEDLFPGRARTIAVAVGVYEGGGVTVLLQIDHVLFAIGVDSDLRFYAKIAKGRHGHL